jgi:DNA modification methylase
MTPIPESHLPQRNRQLSIEHLPPDQLTAMPGAPRVHSRAQLKALIQSIKAFSFNVPVLIDADLRIIAGHARLAAAIECGLVTVPVIRIEHLSPTQIKGFMIAENRLADMSHFDEQKLGEILLELSTVDLDFDIEATGLAMAEIDLRIEGLNEPESDKEEVPVASGPAVVRSGDLWILGEHRLFCGNALEAASWTALLDHERAALVVTDPPFNIPVAGFVSGLGRFQHREFAMGVGEMDQVDFTTFLKTVMEQAHEWSVAGSVHYWAIDWRHVVEMGSAGQQVYDRFLNICVWNKNQPGMGSMYRSQHELFFVYAKAGAPSRNNIQLGRFGRSRSNVWSYPSAASLARTSEEGNPLSWHPTVKPLALVSDILLDASARGDIIADPFGGSGTSLIAAEKLGRKARLIELDPAYCDTIIRRWRNWTGEDAIRADDGVAFSALEIEEGK